MDPADFWKDPLLKPLKIMAFQQPPKSPEKHPGVAPERTFSFPIATGIVLFPMNLLRVLDKAGALGAEDVPDVED